MKVQETLLLVGAAIVLGGGALIALRGDPKPTLADSPPAAVDEPGPAVADPGPQAVQAADLAELPDEQAPVRAFSGEPQTSGTIDGRIQLASDVVGRFERYTIWVEEQINPNAPESPEAPEREPFRKTYPFKAEVDRTPTFAIYGVPFSPYGYRVGVHVPGLNGSSQVVTVTERQWNPQVTLAIARGVVFTLRVIDQTRAPWTGEPVDLRPMERGGVLRQATTDAYGTAIFEDVLAGQYDVWIRDRSVTSVQVQATNLVANVSKLGVQTATVELPRGPTLRVEVNGPNWGVAGAELELYAIDTLANRQLRAVTDFAGIHEFEHVLPGRYQLNVSGEGFQRASRQVRVPAEGNPPVVKIRLAAR
jgi:hypothetical protein